MTADHRLVSDKFPRSNEYDPEWVIASVSGGANSGSSRAWLPLESSLPEVDHDWMCPECMEGHDEEASADDSDTHHLHAICIHCVRSLRKRYDLRFEAN